jgi:hypothetical protein
MCFEMRPEKCIAAFSLVEDSAYVIHALLLVQEERWF